MRILQHLCKKNIFAIHRLHITFLAADGTIGVTAQKRPSSSERFDRLPPDVCVCVGYVQFSHVRSIFPHLTTVKLLLNDQELKHLVLLPGARVCLLSGSESHKNLYQIVTFLSGCVWAI